MSLLSVSHLSFTYDGSFTPVFDDVSFQVDTKWKLGLTGRNGRGKTTLLRILCGELPYQGKIHASVSFERFPYPVTNPQRSVEEVLSSMVPEAELWEIRRECSLLHLSDDIFDRPFLTLSSGEQTKALLAALFVRENAFLLIDEPTNHLDETGRRQVAAYLNRKQGFILVSHDRDFLDGCVDHVMSINRADITVQAGNFSSWWQNKQQQDEWEQQQNEKLQKEIGRLQQSVREKSHWADLSESKKIGFDPRKTEKSMGRRPYEAAKSKKSNKRAKAILQRTERAVEEKSQLLKNVEKTEALRLPVLTDCSGTFFALRDVQVYYEEKVATPTCTFSIQQGDRLALQGANGSGKSTLLHVLCGETLPYTGTIFRNNRMKISYVPQQCDDLRGPLEEYAKQYGVSYTQLLTLLRKLDFDRSLFEVPMDTYSAGQKKKVVLARSLCEQAHLYIWDEPLNYIDVLSRMQIEDLLKQAKPTLVFVEHDARFCREIATKTFVL